MSANANTKSANVYYSLHPPSIEISQPANIYANQRINAVCMITRPLRCIVDTTFDES